MDYEAKMLEKLQMYVDLRRESIEDGDKSMKEYAEDLYWKCKMFVEQVTDKEIVMENWKVSYK